MTTFDLLALGLIAVCVAASAMRGLVGELWNFAGYILSLVLARVLAVPVSETVFPLMSPRPLAVVCAFVLVFVAARVAQHFLHYVFDHIIKTVKLSMVNRILGGCLGALKGVLFVSIIVLACSFSDMPKSPEWRNALTAPFFEQIAALGVPYLPDFLAEQVYFPSRQADVSTPSPSPTE